MTVRVEGKLDSARTGDVVHLAGYLRGASPPDNPGEFDYRRYARMHGIAGLLAVPSAELIEVDPGESAGFVDQMRYWREVV